MATKIQLRRDTPANWSSENPVLSQGEIGLEILTGEAYKIKIGNGVDAWDDLPYSGGSPIASTDDLPEGSSNLYYTDARALDSLAVSTSAGTITLDFETRAQRMFVGSANFATSKSIALANAANALVLDFTFEITNVAATLVFPAGFTMQSDDTRWNSGTRTWTPTATGVYEASATFDGTTWKLKISSSFV